MKRCTPSDGSAAASLSAPAEFAGAKPVDDHHEMADRVARVPLQLASRQVRGPLEIPGEHLHQKGAADQLGRVRIDRERLFVEFRRSGEVAAVLRLTPGQIIAVQARRSTALGGLPAAGFAITGEAAPTRPRRSATDNSAGRSGPADDVAARIGWPLTGPLRYIFG